MAAQAATHPALQIWLCCVWPSLAFILALLLVPVLGPFLLVMRAYRSWQINRIRNRCPDIHVMEPTDAIWYQNSEVNPGIINSLWWLNGKPDLEFWRHILDSRMASATNLNGELLYPKLKQMPKQIWHRYVWVDCYRFDINKIVFMYDREQPKNDSEVAAVLGTLCSKHIPLDMPQWQVILVPTGSKDEDKYVCMTRFHHSIGDGVSLVRMFMDSIVQVDDCLKKQQKDRTPKEGFGTKAAMMKIVKAVLTAPLYSFTRVLSTYDSNALHGPQLSGDKLVAWSRTIDLDFIKKMKNAAGCTVNDILMAALSSTFQTYFRQNCCVTPADIGASVPVDIRQAKPGEVSLDNQFSLVLLRLPLQEDGPIGTLQEVKRRMDVIKQSAEPLINSWTMKYLMSRLPNWLSRVALDRVSDQCSLVVSNMPGPTVPLYISGHVCERMVFWPPQRADIGMAVSILSYNNGVTMGLIVDKMIMSNPGRLVDLFHTSVDHLARELGVPEL